MLSLLRYHKNISRMSVRKVSADDRYTMCHAAAHLQHLGPLVDDIIGGCF